MSKKEGYSRPGLFGGINHYDANGHKIGESRPGLFGGYNDYDAKGHKIGESRPGIFGGMNHYDVKGHKVGESRPGVFGGANHYDANGHKTGHSSKGIFGDLESLRRLIENENTCTVLLTADPQQRIAVYLFDKSGKNSVVSTVEKPIIIKN